MREPIMFFGACWPVADVDVLKINYSPSLASRKGKNGNNGRYPCVLWSDWCVKDRA